MRSRNEGGFGKPKGLLVCGVRTSRNFFGENNFESGESVEKLSGRVCGVEWSGVELGVRRTGGAGVQDFFFSGGDLE